MITKNYYEILEVSTKATGAVIKAAYKVLSQKLGDGHPDQYLLNEAYACLSEADKRSAYDDSRNPNKGKKVVRIGQYRLLEKIAEGGFGVTYKAVHESLDELVCIKQSLNISAIDEALMIEEAKAVFNLRHWAIPAVRDFIRLDDGSVAIVMSYVPGRNLQQIIEKQGALDPEHVCWIAERSLNALLYLHDNGVIHGDVKPANIIVQDTHQVVLVDYGLSLVRPGRGSANKGYTEKFASPEQLANKTLLPESDLYSLGKTMIYALGGDVEALLVPSRVPDAVCRFIKRLVVRDILNRPNWKKENLCQTISDVRQEAFGRRYSQMKPLNLK